MLRSVLEHCEGSGLRPWAIDLSSRSSSSPKCYVAATARDFALAMAAVSPLQRHAYEVVRAVPCCAYFDLECTGSQHELEQADEQAAEVARLEARYLEESTMLSWAPARWRAAAPLRPPLRLPISLPPRRSGCLR